MSTTDGINGPSGTSGSNGSTPELATARSAGLGRDAFLQLLVTQMSHQNPLQPQTTASSSRSWRSSARSSS